MPGPARAAQLEPSGATSRPGAAAASGHIGTPAGRRGRRGAGARWRRLIPPRRQRVPSPQHRSILTPGLCSAPAAARGEASEAGNGGKAEGSLREG